MTVAQVRQLLAAGLTPWRRAYIVAAIMLGLLWSDVDLDGGVLRVRVSLKSPEGKPVLADLKTERSKRTLEMPAAVRSVLRALQQQQAADRLAIGVTAYAGHGLVFARADGHPESRGEVLARFKEVTKAAGIGPDWTLRELRHTFVSFRRGHRHRADRGRGRARQLGRDENHLPAPDRGQDQLGGRCDGRRVRPGRRCIMRQQAPVIGSLIKEHRGQRAASYPICG